MKNLTTKTLRLGLCAGIVILSAQAARADYEVDYNSATGLLTLNVGTNYTLDNLTVYVNNTSNIQSTANITSGWTEYTVKNYALEWAQASPGSSSNGLTAGNTYTLAQLAKGLSTSAFGNTSYGSGDAIGAVVFGNTSGGTTKAQVNISSAPEIPGTMLAVLLLGGAGFVFQMRRKRRTA